MTQDYSYLEGRKFCIVFVKVLDYEKQRVQLQCFRGRASVEQNKVVVFSDEGSVCPVPTSAMGNILPSDGTKILRDAEYFVLVRTSDNMDFYSQN